MDISFITGKTILLRPLLESDAAGDYPAWLNDPDVCAGNSHHMFPYTRGMALDYIRSASAGGASIMLAVVDLESGKHIGNVALQSIDWISRSADFAILIGSRAHWNTGVGKEAARLLCDHGFLALNLERITCGTFDTNTAMQKLALHLGMTQEGRRRRAAYKNGRFLDVLEFGVLRDEYLARFQIKPGGV